MADVPDRTGPDAETPAKFAGIARTRDSALVFCRIVRGVRLLHHEYASRSRRRISSRRYTSRSMRRIWRAPRALPMAGRPSYLRILPSPVLLPSRDLPPTALPARLINGRRDTSKARRYARFYRPSPPPPPADRVKRSRSIISAGRASSTTRKREGGNLPRSPERSRDISIHTCTSVTCMLRAVHRRADRRRSGAPCFVHSLRL